MSQVDLKKLFEMIEEAIDARLLIGKKQALKNKNKKVKTAR